MRDCVPSLYFGGVDNNGSLTWTLAVDAATVERARATGETQVTVPREFAALASTVPGGTPRRDYMPPSVYVSGGEVRLEHNQRLSQDKWFGSDGYIGDRDKMAREWPIIQAGRLAWALSTLSRQWRIDPPKGGDKSDLMIAEFVRTVIEDHFAGGGGGMTGLLSMFATLPTDGFILGQPYYPFDPNITVRDDDGRVVLQGAHTLQIAPIPAWNVQNWLPESGRNGETVWGVEVYNVGGDQQWAQKSRNWGNVVVHADQLVHARFMPQGNDPAPYGLLRPNWSLWEQWRTLSKLQINGWQKAAFGIPQIETTSEANPGDIATVNRIASNLRAGALARYSLPPGFSISYREVPFRAGDIDDTKMQLKMDALAGMFAQHVGTGSNNGTQALHGSQKQEFHQLAEYVARSIVGVLCSGPVKSAPVKRLVSLNFDGVASYPRLSFGPMPVSDPVGLVDAITKASEKSALTLDGQIEASVRDALNLPEMPMETAEAWAYRLQNSAPPEISAPDADEEEDDEPDGPDEPPPSGGGGGGETDSGGEEADEVEGESQALSDVVALAGMDPARVMGDRMVAGPGGRAVRPLETVVRLSETLTQTNAGKDEVASILTQWRMETAPMYADTLEARAKSLGDVATIPVPNQRDLVQRLTVALRRVYRAGRVSVENETERIEENPTLVADLASGEQVGEALPAPERTLTAAAESDTHTPPQAVRDAARRALEVRESKPPSERGMTPVGLARARDLSNGRPVSVATIRRMKAYFDRHEVDKQGSTWGDKGKGWQAWNGWGGDAGRSWANGIIRREDGARAASECGCGAHGHGLVCMSLSERLTALAALAAQPVKGGKRKVKAPKPAAGLPPSDADGIDPNDAIEGVARTTAAAMASRLRNSAQSTLQNAGIGGALPSSGIGALVTDAIEALSPGIEANQAQGDVNTLFGLGRTQEQRAQGAERYVFSNLLESQTCQFCDQFDGTVFGADELDFFATPFQLCEGGDKCNCLILGVPPEQADFRPDLS